MTTLQYYGGPCDGLGCFEGAMPIEEGELIEVPYSTPEFEQPMMRAVYRRFGNHLVFVRTENPPPIEHACNE